MSQYTMSERDQDLLRTKRVFLLKNVNTSSLLLAYLHSVSILTEDMMEEIEVEKLKKSKIGKMLDILKRRGPHAFKHFVFGLMESDQPHAAKGLDEDLANQWETENPRSQPSPGIRHSSKRPSFPEIKPITPCQPPTFKPTGDPDDEDTLLTADVTPIDETDTHVMKLLTDTDNVYKMTSKPRGRAIIINNSYFVNNQPRDGAHVDTMNLCTFWEKLDFDVALHQDLRAAEMKAVMIQESKKDWNADCLVVFVLSHGAQGYVYGIDGQRVAIEDDLVTPFDGQHCPALANKPKIFFVQACQGASVTQGVTEDGGDSQVDAAPISAEDEQLSEALNNLRLQDTEENFPHIGRSHEKSDIVLAYSTVPGYRSWRRSDLGSWFVRAVIQVFSREAHHEDVLSLLVKVRQKVAENRTNHTDAGFLQLTRTDETTRKKVFFFPGYYHINRGDNV